MKARIYEYDDVKDHVNHVNARTIVSLILSQRANNLHTVSN